jgi:protein tyrosine phosphatase (PTP) superfamily phosphohydrolase (DUF442 family)
MRPLRWLLGLGVAVGLCGCACKHQNVAPPPCDRCGPGQPPSRFVPMPQGDGLTPAPQPNGQPFRPGQPFQPGGQPQPFQPGQQPQPFQPGQQPLPPEKGGVFEPGQVRQPSPPRDSRDALADLGPQQQSTWRPAPDTPYVPLRQPEPDGQEPPRDAGKAQGDTAPRDQGPAKVEKPADAEAPPVDLPGFRMVQEGVATGRQPFPDGVAWLQAKGYRTILHVRAAEEKEITSARMLFEKRGLGYVSLEVAPRAITREAVETFNRTVADTSARPLFVFDRDGDLAGALWYLHYRTAGGLGEDQALAAAAKLGFKPDFSDAHRAAFDSAQALLRK